MTQMTSTSETAVQSSSVAVPRVRVSNSEGPVDSLAQASREAFVNAMRGAVTGVNVVTTDGLAGRFGLTVSAFTSVSAEPPMVLVCINRRSPACAAIRENRRFCVNVLSTTQRSLADSFAGHPTDGLPYDFDAGRWDEAIAGAPALEGAVANFACALHTAATSGSHAIFIGRALAVNDAPGQPLLYTNRSYGQPQGWN